MTAAMPTLCCPRCVLCPLCCAAQTTLWRKFIEKGVADNCREAFTMWKQMASPTPLSAYRVSPRPSSQPAGCTPACPV
jgi:hypothetical protein